MSGTIEKLSGNRGCLAQRTEISLFLCCLKFKKKPLPSLKRLDDKQTTHHVFLIIFKFDFSGHKLLSSELENPKQTKKKWMDTYKTF